jgi:hypothetical protein
MDVSDRRSQMQGQKAKTRVRLVRRVEKSQSGENNGMESEGDVEIKTGGTIRTKGLVWFGSLDSPLGRSGAIPSSGRRVSGLRLVRDVNIEIHAILPSFSLPDRHHPVPDLRRY